MRLPLIVAAAVLASVAGAARAAPSVEVRDAVVRVTVIPEDRTDVKVEVVKASPKLPLAVRVQGERTILDGKLDWDVGACSTSGGRPVVRVKKVGAVAWDDMPQVVIRTPRSVVMTAGGAVFGAVGRSQSLDLVNAGCGDWVIANVEGKFAFSQAGSGDSRIGAVGQAGIRSAGAGDVSLVSARNGLTINIAGSGDVAVGEASGPFDIRVAGSGDVDIEKGAADAVSVTIAGSGDVDFGGRAESLKASVAGSGDVRVRAVSGAVTKRIVGSGGVTIGGTR